MERILIIVLICLMSVYVLSLPVSIFVEKREFNKGFCTECGEKLQHFDDDSTGAQGWCCDKCNRVIWLNWVNRTGKYG